MKLSKRLHERSLNPRQEVVRTQEYVSPAEGEARYPFSRWTLRQWAYTGRIESVKIGGAKGRLLIPVAEIERVIEEGRRPRAGA
jgi:hypothetical protein